MTVYSAYLYLDVHTARTHLAAWRNRDEGWIIPCGLIALPPSDAVTYSPRRPLCQTCSRLTETFDVIRTPTRKEH